MRLLIVFKIILLAVASLALSTDNSRISSWPKSGNTYAAAYRLPAISYNPVIQSHTRQCSAAAKPYIVPMPASAYIQPVYSGAGNNYASSPYGAPAVQPTYSYNAPAAPETSYAPAVAPVYSQNPTLNIQTTYGNFSTNEQTNIQYNGTVFQGPYHHMPTVNYVNYGSEDAAYNTNSYSNQGYGNNGYGSDGGHEYGSGGGSVYSSGSERGHGSSRHGGSGHGGSGHGSSGHGGSGHGSSGNHGYRSGNEHGRSGSGHGGRGHGRSGSRSQEAAARSLNSLATSDEPTTTVDPTTTDETTTSDETTTTEPLETTTV